MGRGRTPGEQAHAGQRRASPAIDPHGSVLATTWSDPWIEAALDPDALRPELEIVVDSDARGQAKLQVAAWARLREDGEVDMAGLTLSGLGSGPLELARSDVRSRFRDAPGPDADAGR